MAHEEFTNVTFDNRISRSSKFSFVNSQ